MNLINFTNLNAEDGLCRKAEEFKKLKSGERHNKLYGLAVAAYYAGYDTQESLKAYLLSVYDECSGGADVEDVEATTKKIIANAGGEIVETSKSCGAKKKSSMDAKKNADKHKEYWLQWCRDILQHPITVSDEGDLSNAELEEKRKEAVASICGDMKDLYFFVGDKRTDRQDNSYITDGYNPGILEYSPLFCSNPLSAKNRKKSNCTHVNYLVLEMDEAMAPLTSPANTEAGMEELIEQQLHLWDALKDKLPIKSITYSGNKSLHALIAVDTTVEELELKRQELVAAYTELHFDIANIDAVRKTRIPWGFRYFAQGEDGALLDIDTAKYLQKVASGYGIKAKEARDKLNTLKIKSNNIKCVGRFQDCLLLRDDIEHISLDTFIAKLKAIVDEFLPTADNAFEQALARRDNIPMTQHNFEEYLKFKNRKIYTDEITRLPIFKGFAVDNPNTIPNQILDDWYSLADKFPSAEKVKLCIEQTLAAHHVNSVLEWLDTIEWDGTSRLGHIYSILHINDNFSQTLVKKWLVQCVAMLENGINTQYGIDGVLTLIGKQGDGKTSFFRKLIPIEKQKDWFAEGRSLDTENTDSRRQLTRGWIMELGEVDSTTKKEQSSLKALLTASVDEIRKPYQVYADTTYRHVSVCASVNKEEYLRDETGNRRWWSIRITQPIDLDAMSQLDIAQLWAEIKHEWDNSDKVKQDAFRLTTEERIKLENINSCQREDAGFEELIKERFEFGADKNSWTAWTLEKICSELLHYPPKPADKKMMSRSLEALKLKVTRPHNVKHFILPPLKRY